MTRAIADLFFTNYNGNIMGVAWVYWRIYPQTNRQTFGFGPLLITVLFLALKKTGFFKKKNFSQKKKKNFYLFSMQLFSADAMVFSKKNLKKYF